MRKQYHFWPGENGLDAWDVDRLILLSAGLPVTEVPLDSIGEIDTDYWFFDGSDLPTVRRIVEHCRLIEDVDLSYPIILGADGRVMDGMHRVERAPSWSAGPGSPPSGHRPAGTGPPGLPARGPAVLIPGKPAVAAGQTGGPEPVAPESVGQGVEAGGLPTHEDLDLAVAGLAPATVGIPDESRPLGDRPRPVGRGRPGRPSGAPSRRSPGRNAGITADLLRPCRGPPSAPRRRGSTMGSVSTMAPAEDPGHHRSAGASLEKRLPEQRRPSAPTQVHGRAAAQVGEAAARGPPRPWPRPRRRPGRGPSRPRDRRHRSPRTRPRRRRPPSRGCS